MSKGEVNNGSGLGVLTIQCSERLFLTVECTQGDIRFIDLASSLPGGRIPVSVFSEARKLGIKKARGERQTVTKFIDSGSAGEGGETEMPEGLREVREGGKGKIEESAMPVGRRERGVGEVLGGAKPKEIT
jgi:hypothetical protein